MLLRPGKHALELLAVSWQQRCLRQAKAKIFDVIAEEDESCFSILKCVKHTFVCPQDLESVEAQAALDRCFSLTRNVGKLNNEAVQRYFTRTTNELDSVVVVTDWPDSASYAAMLITASTRI